MASYKNLGGIALYSLPHLSHFACPQTVPPLTSGQHIEEFSLMRPPHWQHLKHSSGVVDRAGRLSTSGSGSGSDS